jgi:hypothetical protein
LGLLDWLAPFLLELVEVFLNKHISFELEFTDGEGSGVILFTFVAFLLLLEYFGLWHL